MKWDLREKWDHRVDLLQVNQVDRDLKDRGQVNQAAHQQMIWQDQADQVQDQMDNQMYQVQVYNQVDQVDQAVLMDQWVDRADQDQDQDLKDRDQVNQAAHQQMIWLDQADQVQDQVDNQMCQVQVYNQVDLQADLLQVKELGEMDHHHQVDRDQNLIQQVDLQVDLPQVDQIWDQMDLQADLLQVNQVDLPQVDQIWIL